MKRIIALLCLASSALYAVPLNIDEYRRITANGGLHLRTKPTVTAASLALVPDGAFVQLLSESESVEEIGGKLGKWTKVRFGRLEGWVFGAYLQKPESFIHEPTGDPKAVFNLTLNESLDCTGLTYSEYGAELTFKNNGEFRYVLGGATVVPCNSKQIDPNDGLNGEMIEDLTGRYSIEGNKIIVTHVKGTKKYRQMQQCRFPPPSTVTVNHPETFVFFPVQCRDLKGNRYPAVVSTTFGYRADLIWVFNKEE